MAGPGKETDSGKPKTKKAKSKKTPDRRIVPAAKNAITEVDEKLVNRALQDIRVILDETVGQAQIRIGAYILETFYDNKIEEYRAHNPKKHASLNALVEKCESIDLPVKKTFLQTSINVAFTMMEIEKKLGEGDHAFPELPASHRSATLPLRDPEKIEEVAKKVRDEGLTVRQAREVVREELDKARSGKETRAGRKPKHPIVKAIEGSVRTLKRGTERIFFYKDEIKTLKDRDVENVQDNINVLRSALDDLSEKLQGSAE